MNKRRNITFFLGAGASYFACPILNEQGEKMKKLAKVYFEQKGRNIPPINENDLNDEENIMLDILKFGEMAIEFGTIDTYAKKLFLNGSHNSQKELIRLKIAVSVFFTIWQFTEDFSLKSSNHEEFNTFDPIDKRYISLMASILEKGKQLNDIHIKKNIRFVTWNYDLQLEYAFKTFDNNVSWDNIFEYLDFNNKANRKRPFEICHLNGYHGCHKNTSTIIEKQVLDTIHYKEITNIISQLSFLNRNQQNGSNSKADYINYAWEKNPISIKTRLRAKKIFSETDILVIIGYSFPNFNKEIDSQLFQKLSGRKTKVYYQDPNASASFISQLINNDECEIICETKKLDHFFLPYEF